MRYRYDALKRRRYTTAEIVVSESEWDPLPAATARREHVPVRIAIQETILREKVKAAGGRWDHDQRVWMLRMEQVIQLGLTGRVKDKTAPPCVVSTEEDDIFPTE